MEKIRTKEAAESALRDLPSVLGAFVREDIRGNPREVHILVGPAPNARDLARDVRGLLEEWLGLRIDQRIISIAQLVQPLDPAGDDAAASPVESSGPATPSAPVPSAAPVMPPVSVTSAESEAALELGAPPVAALEAPAARAAEPRLVLERIGSHAVDGRVRVSVRIGVGGRSFVGKCGELDGGTGRIRAAAKATLAVVMEASGGELQLEVTRAQSVRALGREYVVVGVLAGSERLGRRLRPLLGAQPLGVGGAGEEDAAALATLHAVNRIAAAHASLVTR